MLRRRVLACLLALSLATATLHARITDRIQVGKVYAVIWAYKDSGAGIREVLVVRKKDKTGWVLAANLEAPTIEWWVNLNMALSVKEYVFDPHTALAPAFEVATR